MEELLKQHLKHTKQRNEFEVVYAITLNFLEKLIIIENTHRKLGNMTGRNYIVIECKI